MTVRSNERFYITTAIDYPNGSPHMGHAYEKVVTDFYARWYRLMGRQVYFLTGTDENGQKLVKSADDAKATSTKDYVDQNVVHFKKLCDRLNITYNDFIRTTEERHEKVCQQIWKTLKDKGHIYFGTYQGNYCLGCEAFYTELQAPDGLCPNHHSKLEIKSEAGYFLKMEAFHQWILNHFKSHINFVIPRSSYNEILSRLEKEDLKDLAISRPNNGWGIAVPDDNKFVMYTWFDALINYYSALQVPKDESAWWPASTHVIGKDIAWFHSVIWPIMLHAAGIALPQQIYVHGMVLAADGRKMSKSLGNGVDPMDILDKYPTDSFRFYLLKAISGHGDGPFAEKDLMDKHNNELANDFGNLLMRVVKFARSKISDTISADGAPQEFNYQNLINDMDNLIAGREHHKAIDRLWEGVKEANQYMNTREPWKLKDKPLEMKQVIYNLLYAIHHLSLLASPIMPSIAAQTLNYLGVVSDEGSVGPFDPEKLQFGKITYFLKEPAALFPKFETAPETTNKR